LVRPPLKTLSSKRAPKAKKSLGTAALGDSFSLMNLNCVYEFNWLSHLL